MYTDEDLSGAVDEGIFTSEAVDSFREHISSSKATHTVDEENFKLVTGFNDIFVVIACVLLLVSGVWVVEAVHQTLALWALPVLAWGLAEFFVLKRKMALPAIVLLLVFVGGVFAAVLGLFEKTTEADVIWATALATLAAYLHWQRFRVPLTVAAGTAAVIGFFVSCILMFFDGSQAWIMPIIFVFGLAAFSLAMYWDISDCKRITYRSDVAFWLHLLAVPLIVHPIFSGLGILDGHESLMNVVIVIILYVLMTLVSVLIDRRAFMVSSLVYVLYALSALFEAYGMVGYSLALTGVCIGVALLLLSAFWHTVRAQLIDLLPSSLQQYIPH